MDNKELIMPDENEIKLLKLIRSGEYDKIVVSLKHKKMSSLALIKEQNTKKKKPTAYNKQNEENEQFLQKQFPKLQLDEITAKMKEISEISERLAKYKKESEKND